MPDENRNYSSKPLIEVSEITKIFPARGGMVTLYSGLSFTVEQGEFVCVVGPNGVGKTTLLKLIAGLISPTTGKITLFSGNGEQLEKPSPQLDFALVSQEEDLLPWLDVRNNLLMGLRRNKDYSSDSDALVKSYLKLVNLDGFEGFYPAQLSEGMRKRLSIARSFASGASCILMDEPFASLDYFYKLELRKLTTKVWEELKRTIIFVTHDMDEAVALGKRILFLSAGQDGQPRVIPVSFPAPRDPLALRRTHDYNELVAQLNDKMTKESEKSSPLSKNKTVSGERTISWGSNFLSIFLALLIWESFSRFHILDPRFFPPPTLIASHLASLFASGLILPHIGISLWRVFWGLVVGGIPAVILGLASGVYPVVRKLLYPLVIVAYPVPKIAILPFLLLVFGLGESSKILMISLGVFFLVYFSTLQGVGEIQKAYLEIVKVFRLTGKEYFYDFLLKGSLSPILHGFRLALGYALLILVAAEFSGANAGLGFFIWRSWEVFDIPSMYSGLVLISLFGYFFTVLLDLGIHRVLPWQEQR